MNKEITKRHNEIVTSEDTVIHVGDFTLNQDAEKYISQLNGHHIFLLGSHDRWLKNKRTIQIWEKLIEKHYVVVCHYAMRTWARSHYNSWNLYAHSHGKLPSIGKSLDIGVDTNNFYPYSFEQIKEIMKTKPDNPNIIKKHLQTIIPIYERKNN
jgi:calcineurin-like phosphoesterase family protein